MPSNTHLVFRWTEIQVLECGSNILGEPRPKDILVCAELVPGLPHDGVDDVQARHFVLRLALQTERRACIRIHQEHPPRASQQPCPGAATWLCIPAPRSSGPGKHEHRVLWKFGLSQWQLTWSSAPPGSPWLMGNLTIHFFPPLLHVSWKTTMWSLYRQSDTKMCEILTNHNFLPQSLNNRSLSDYLLALLAISSKACR